MMTVGEMWREHNLDRNREEVAAVMDQIRKDFGPERQAEAGALIASTLRRLAFAGHIRKEDVDALGGEP